MMLQTNWCWFFFARLGMVDDSLEVMGVVAVGVRSGIGAYHVAADTLVVGKEGFVEIS